MIFLISGAVFISSSNLLRIGTDSGFDTSYDSGGSSGGSSSGGSSGSSYGSSSSSGGGSGGKIIWTKENILIVSGIVVLFLISVCLCYHSMKHHWYARFQFGYISFIVISIYLVILSLNLSFFLAALPFALLFLIPVRIHLADDIKAEKGISKRKQISEVDMELIGSGFQHYIAVQEALTNFDYDELKNLLTDSLYQSYKKKLDLLKLKNMKYIMNDFSLISYKILSKKNDRNKVLLKLQLKMSFYNYVINAKNDIIGGTSDDKIEKEYVLTFISQNDEDICPICNTVLNSNSICKNCGFDVSLSFKNMKLERVEE